VGGWGGENSSSKAFGISFADRPKAKMAEKKIHCGKTKKTKTLRSPQKRRSASTTCFLLTKS
jgi:hypothetical protein